MDTYSAPEHGWTCYHCGETFKTPGAARDHFGGEPSALAGCQIKVGAERGLLMALRRAEFELIEYRQDDCIIARRMAQMQGRHADALRDAEELGYERGLRDGQRLAEEERKKSGAAQIEPAALVIDYTNWRGERGRRTILPERIFFGSTPWHQEPQWLLDALDVEKDEPRTFALKWIHAWEIAP